jgi:hypothetical protein
MEGRGFSRRIASADGKAYQLPWAEYNGSGNLTSSQVRDIARDAANSTGKSNAVLVTESQSRPDRRLAREECTPIPGGRCGTLS